MSQECHNWRRTPRSGRVPPAAEVCCASKPRTAAGLRSSTGSRTTQMDSIFDTFTDEQPAGRFHAGAATSGSTGLRYQSAEIGWHHANSGAADPVSLLPRRRRPSLGCVSPRMRLAPEFGLDGSRTVASSMPMPLHCSPICGAWIPGLRGAGEDRTVDQRSPSGRRDGGLPQGQKPPDVSRVVGLVIGPQMSRSLQPFDDGHVGLPAAFAHRLEAVTSAGALEFVQQRCHHGAHRCSRCSSGSRFGAGR